MMRVTWSAGALLVVAASAIAGVDVRDADGVTYRIERGSVAIAPSPSGTILDLPSFVEPSFRIQPSGSVLAALQTASGVRVYRIDPERATAALVRSVRGSSRPLLSAGGLWCVTDDGGRQSLVFLRDGGKPEPVATFPEIGGYSVASRDGRLTVAFGAAWRETERIFIAEGSAHGWQRARAITPAHALRYAPDVTFDGSGRVRITCLGLDGDDTRAYLLTARDGHELGEQVISPTGTSASSLRFLDRDHIVWISSAAQGERLLYADTRELRPRVFSATAKDLILRRVHAGLFTTLGHHLRIADADGALFAEESSRPVPLPAAASAPLPDRYAGFGDSIMEGNSADNSSSEEAAFYPYLRDQLTAYYGVTAEVFNEGRSGENTGPGLERIDATLATFTPGYLCIMEGTNDITRRRDHYTSNSTARNLQLMAEKCVAWGTVPILSTLIPRTRKDPYDPKNTSTRRWNRSIKKMIEKNGFRGVDLYRAFTGVDDWQDTLMADRLHPSPAGYQLMGEIWLGAIEAAKGPPPPPPPPTE